MIDTLTEMIEAAITAETRAAVASLVEHEIEREYGVGNHDARAGARLLALAGLEMDLTDFAPARGLRALAETQLRIMMRDGLAARRCECAAYGDGHPHSSGVRCDGHTEADVPVLPGGRYCGGCYIAETSPTTTTYERVDDDGTETLVVTQHGAEVRAVYTLDGAELDDSSRVFASISEADRYLHDRIIDWTADGYRLA